MIEITSKKEKAPG